MRTLRLQKMKDYINEKGAVSFEELCRVFEISINTARRDIAILETDGSITKVYGGVKTSKPSGLVPYKERYIKNLDQKLAICRKAAEFVQDGDVIFLDAGTTVHYMLDYLQNLNITVITASLTVLIKAAKMPNIRLYTLSGTLNRESNSFEDIGASAILERYAISKAFMAASGYSITNGITHASPWEYEMKHAILSRKNTDTYLLVDNTKIDSSAIMKYGEANDIKNLVTCPPVSDKYTEFLQSQNIKLHLAIP